MNKFEKVRFHVDLVEAASKAVMNAARCRVRYDSDYVKYDDSESPDWYDDSWLDDHVTDAGREYLNMAEEFSEQLNELL